MSTQYETYLDEQRETWEATPEGQEAVRRQALEDARLRAVGLEARAAAAERECRWRKDHPREWAEWERVRLLWDDGPLDLTTLPAKRYDFGDFLAEVGPNWTARAKVVRKDHRLPYRSGNLTLEKKSKHGSPNSPYLRYREVVAQYRIPKTTLYDLRKAGKLDCVKIPGMGYLFPRASLERLVKDHTVPAGPTVKAPAKPARRRAARKAPPPANLGFRFL